MDGLLSLCLLLVLFGLVIALLVWVHIRLTRIEERLGTRDHERPGP